ncbi:MAG: hypothetical protein GEV28_32530 [Actinophytocola sp.]|uniref:hypothetical protein n=1 Tax=Actinophytocola sp. TaxID=1872138 RepID=UPI0013209098|nr:hypothetical protein [Actinophytocola sp.]MPZ84858.1 hypothetical protein [Actinophytocola sp.]
MSRTSTTRRWDGKPETPADRRFFDLRESGYRGPIDHNGTPVAEGREREHLLGEGRCPPPATTHPSLINPGPVETSRQADSHRVGAPNHHHNDGSGEKPMVRLGLDDTLHAIVRVTHEHGLPLHGASVLAGTVQVFTDAVALPWWVRWLTEPAAEQSRVRVWEKDAEVAFHVTAHREGIEWAVVERGLPEVVGPVLDTYGVTVTGEHVVVPSAAAVALADALADHVSVEGGAR